MEHFNLLNYILISQVNGVNLHDTLVPENSLQWNVKLELVFIKHYAPNICLSSNMVKFAVS